jgi:hypothetical protein
MYKTELFVEEIAAGGFTEPVGRRSSFTSSRLAILADGTTKPVLLILAERQFKPWEPERFPFWIDGDRTNETLPNVGLATRASGLSRTRAKRTRNAFGVPAGSREYMKRWRAAHPEQVRASQTRYYEKRRAIGDALSDEPIDAPLVEPLPDDIPEVPDIFRKLESILKE